MPSSHLSLKAVPTSRGPGEMIVVAAAPIARGETVAAFGGRCVTREQLAAMRPALVNRALQIDEDLFLAGDAEPEPSDWIRHSCAPSCGMRSSVLLVAMRDIAPGEEITYDYAMSDGSDDDGFECGCGAPQCRHKVLGSDWLLPELQLRYRGYFTPYLAARISGLLPMGAERRAFAY